MSSSTDEPETQADWEITPAGLYVATRGFLLRRGYCCANQCRNCPYINWRDNPDWLHAPATAIRAVPASPKVLNIIRATLAGHERALATVGESEQAQRREMIRHYRTLLELWSTREEESDEWA